MLRKRNQSKSIPADESAGTGTPVRRRAPSQRKTTVTPTEAPAPTISRPADATVARAPAPQDMSSEPRRKPTAERDEIASLAYSYWESRGRQGGSAEDDWLRAERELRRRRAAV